MLRTGVCQNGRSLSHCRERQGRDGRERFLDRRRSAGSHGRLAGAGLAEARRRHAGGRVPALRPPGRRLDRGLHRAPRAISCPTRRQAGSPCRCSAGIGARAGESRWIASWPTSNGRSLPHVTHWNHPGFMAYFATSGALPGVFGGSAHRRPQQHRLAVENLSGVDGTGAGHSPLAARVAAASGELVRHDPRRRFGGQPACGHRRARSVPRAGPRDRTAVRA